MFIFLLEMMIPLWVLFVVVSRLCSRSRSFDLPSLSKLCLAFCDLTPLLSLLNLKGFALCLLEHNEVPLWFYSMWGICFLKYAFCGCYALREATLCVYSATIEQQAG